MTERWASHEVIDNATVGRLETMIEEYEDLDPAARNMAYLAESRARDALADLKAYAAAMERAQERVRTSFRTMLETRHALENALMENANAEELTDELQDAGTYILAVLSIKVILASATVALVAGTTISVLGTVNDLARSDGGLDPATQAANAVGTTNDAIHAGRSAGVWATQGARPVFGAALTVANQGKSAWDAFHSEPVIARLEGNTAGSFDALRSQIDRQSWFSDKSRLRSLTNEAEHAQNAYNRAVQDLNRKTLEYARKLAIARDVTTSKPR